MRPHLSTVMLVILIWFPHSSSMSTEYAAQWPVPPESEQPPNKPLRSRRSDTRAYEFGLYSTMGPGMSAVASYSLLPAGFPGRVELNGADAAKASFDDERFDGTDTWIRMRLDIPFRDLLIDQRHLSEFGEHPVPKLRPTEEGPILTVQHMLDVMLICSYDMPQGGADRLVDELRLTIPLSFVRVPRSGEYYGSGEWFPAESVDPLSRTGPTGLVRMRPERVPPTQTQARPTQSLPGYNQLYYKNGTRREDLTPLPRYTPKGQPAPEEEPASTAAQVVKQMPLPIRKDLVWTPRPPRLHQ